MAHRHTAQMSSTCVWTHCCDPYAYHSQSAHGGVTIMEECSCGAVRYVETTGPTTRTRHASTWEIPTNNTASFVRATSS